MPFTIPNEAAATHPEQAGIYQTDIDCLVAGHGNTGVVSGCAVSQRAAGANMSVDVAVGEVAVAGAKATVAAGNVAVTAAHGSLPRFDLVVVSNAGVKSVTAGTAAAIPIPPAIPANSVLLATIFIPAADTAIGNAQIIDKRVMLTPVLATPYCDVERNAAQSIANNTGVVFSADTEHADAWGMHSAGAFTVPTGWGGRWLCVVRVVFATGTAGVREIWHSINGVDSTYSMNRATAASTAPSRIGGSVELTLAAGDVFRVVVYHTQGSAVNLFGRVTFSYLGPS